MMGASNLWSDVSYRNPKGPSYLSTLYRIGNCPQGAGRGRRGRGMFDVKECRESSRLRKRSSLGDVWSQSAGNLLSSVISPNLVGLQLVE